MDKLRLLRLAKHNVLLFHLKTKLISALETYFGFLFLLLGSEVLVVHSQVLTYFLRQILHQNLALGWRLELQVLLELLKVDNIALRLSIAHFEALLKHLGESRLDFV